MSQTGSANGSFCGNFVCDQLWRRLPHFIPDLSEPLTLTWSKSP